MNKTSNFGTHQNQNIELHTLDNGFLQIAILNLGGIIQSIKMPNRDGVLEDIVLGFNSVQEYLENPFISGIIGRFANRINAGRFVIDGNSFQLKTNADGQHLHGGDTGFDRKIWQVQKIENSPKEKGISLKYTSPDNEEGYPGNLDVTVEYLLNSKNELIVNYTAVTDKPTIINLTNHPTFNLNGNAKRNILNHIVQIHSNKYLETNSDLIPTGKILEAKNAFLDLANPTQLNKKLEEFGETEKDIFGYDHCFVLDNQSEMIKCATVQEPKSKRQMEIWTSEPGLQFYTGNGLNGVLGKENSPYNKHFGLCFEPQNYPDSPNHKNFPNCILRPKDIYKSKTIYKFKS